MSDDASKFDPRFDPAFQRGYDGPTQAVPREKLQPVVTTAPATQTRPPAQLIEPAMPPASPPQQQRVVIEPTGDELDETPRRVNPFLIGLLGVAVLLVGGGLYISSRLSAMFADPSGTVGTDYITLQVLTIAAPMLVVLGLATAIGVAFVYAVRWGRD